MDSEVCVNYEFKVGNRQLLLEERYHWNKEKNYEHIKRDKFPNLNNNCLYEKDHSF